jgi:hypothetical protein
VDCNSSLADFNSSLELSISSRKLWRFSWLKTSFCSSSEIRLELLVERVFLDLFGSSGGSATFLTRPVTIQHN